MWKVTQRNETKQHTTNTYEKVMSNAADPDPAATPANAPNGGPMSPSHSQNVPPPPPEHIPNPLDTSILEVPDMLMDADVLDTMAVNLSRMWNSNAESKNPYNIDERDWTLNPKYKLREQLKRFMGADDIKWDKASFFICEQLIKTILLLGYEIQECKSESVGADEVHHCYVRCVVC